jgi:hypothetical protein
METDFFRDGKCFEKRKIEREWKVKFPGKVNSLSIVVEKRLESYDDL